MICMEAKGINKMIEKIRKAIKDGSIIEKTCRKIHHNIPIYVVDNKNIEFQLRMSKVYKKYEKKYKDIIMEGIEEKETKKTKTVWICWFQGEASAPPLVKACISSVRRNLSGYDVIVITDENVSQYIQFPNYIEDKWKQGKIPFAHYSDLLRTELLCKYGGIWIDATVYCTSELPNYISSVPLFLYKQMDLIHLDTTPSIASSWLISSVSNNKILLLTRKLLFTYWEKHSTLNNYFLFHIFLTMAARRYWEEWNSIPTFNNHSPHTLFFELDTKFNSKRWEEIKQISCFHKLNHHIKYENIEDTYLENILNNENNIWER